MPKPQNLHGMRYGRLTVLEFSHRNAGRYWRCSCDCGGEIIATTGALNSGQVAACGCRQREHAFKLAKGNVTHGKTLTPEYFSWKSMHARCKRDVNYVTNGITICDKWSAFELFYADMGSRPKNTTLERLDNKKGYEPANCVWATPFQQTKNRSNTRYFDHCGETKTLSEWSSQFNINYYTLYDRIFVQHLSFSEAITKVKFKGNGFKRRIKKADS